MQCRVQGLAQTLRPTRGLRGLGSCILMPLSCPEGWGRGSGTAQALAEQTLV